MTETEERESIKNNTKKKEKVSTKNNIRKKDKTMNKDQVRIYIKKRSIIIQKKLSKSLFPPFNLFQMRVYTCKNMNKKTAPKTSLL